MKEKKMISRIFGLAGTVLALTVALLAFGMRSADTVLLKLSPEAPARAEALMEAVSSGAYADAGTMLYGQPDLGTDRAPADAVGQLLWDAYVDSIDYTLVGECIPGSGGLAQGISFTSLDLQSVTSVLKDRSEALLTQRVESAEDVSQVYDADNNYREDFVMEVLYDAAQQILASKAKYTTREFTVELVSEGGQWWVRPNGDLIAAMSAGTTNQISGGIMDKFDMFMTNTISDALNDVLAIEKVYWLSDADLVAPEPDPAAYGKVSAPEEMEPIIAQAEELLAGQQLHFDRDIQIMEGNPIRYYLDETLFTVTWKELHGTTVYTFAEVKIADPSQFRRFLAGGEYGSEKQFVTTEMADSVNAVLASSGDFYRFRSQGIIVYNGIVERVNSYKVDTCMIDDQGDMHFVKIGQLMDIPSAQAYVDEHNIRFSLAFGPILIDDGVRCEPHDYYLGEVNDYFPRAALCQLDDLHYMIVIASEEGENKFNPNIHIFAEKLASLGCIDKAYALDGGQTAVIALDGELVNPVYYGYQREISDIIYFATAVPDGG